MEIRTLEQAIREAQNYFCDVVPSEVSLVDELIADRLTEAERE